VDESVAAAPLNANLLDDPPDDEAEPEEDPEGDAEVEPEVELELPLEPEALDPVVPVDEEYPY
jgi:hypothetical protein